MKNLIKPTLAFALALGATGMAFATDNNTANNANNQNSYSTNNPNSTYDKSASRTTANANDESAQPGTDAWITTKVKTELMTTKGVPSTDISVTTNNGTVTLSGIVDTKAQVQKSIAVAKAVKGVKNVDSSALSSRQ